MRLSPVLYIADAKLCGTIFDTDDATGLVSGVNTGFFVDHAEPLEALEQLRHDWNWPLGDLPDGYEFLLLVPAKRRRSRSQSSSRSTNKAASNG